LLLSSTDLTLESAVSRVRALGGMAIPAHVDRTSYSLLENLGFVPQSLDCPALELFRLTSPADACARWPQLTAWPLIHNGDAHRLNEISPALGLTVAECSLAELALAFAGRGGRSYCLLP
jgi:3',5'-nucleoside bisphosphate phosphatase